MLTTGLRVGVVALGVLLVAYIGVCLYLRLHQNRLIFFPTAALTATPASLGLPYRDVWIAVRSGTAREQIHGWWIPASAAKGTILHLHGNGYNISANLAQARCFHQLGYTVLMIDYRGYGQSRGAFPTEQSVYVDAQAAWDYLTHERGISPHQIAIFGHSLGGAIALHLALEQPNAAALIVQSSFTSVREMLDYSGQFWMFPVDWLLHQRFDSLAKVAALRVPVLYVHGTVDTVTSPQMSQALYEATQAPRQLLLIPAANHNDVQDVGGQTYLRAIEDFLRSHLTAPSRLPRPD